MAKHDSVYIVVPGAKQGGRIGLVKYNEKGYYQTDFDNAPVALEIVESVVKDFNERLGIPEEVVEAMHAGSMFGWHVPGAKAAHDYFGVGIHQRIDAKVEAGVNALTSAVDRAEAKTGHKLTITEAPTPQLVDVTPQALKTPEGVKRAEQAQKEWDDATHEIANTLKRIIDDIFDRHIDKVARAEYYSELQTLLGIRDVKQDAFIRAVTGR